MIFRNDDTAPHSTPRLTCLLLAPLLAMTSTLALAAKPGQPGSNLSSIAMSDNGSLVAMCSLPYTRGKPGNDCNGTHEVQYSVTGADENTRINVELMSLDTQGELIDIRNVDAGDEVHMASRIDNEDYQFSTVMNKNVTRHKVFAPIPLLRITAQNASEKVQAFCSNVPFVKVMEPNGNVVTASSGDVTRVSVAIPGVDTSTMSVLVDGIDILPALGINPATDLPGGPFSGSVNIDGQQVEVEKLVISSADLEIPSANMLSMKLRQLGGGGHIVYVESDSQANRPANNPASACHIDDLADAGTVSIFEVNITSPQAGETTSQVPTPVTGLVRHGRPIEGLAINGQSIDVSTQSFTAGDGKNSADEYVLNFDTLMWQAELARDVSSGDGALERFDPGSNRVIADAADDKGNHAFDNHIFAVGQMGKPEMPSDNTAIGQALTLSVESLSTSIVMAAMTEAQSESQVDNSILVGLNKEALAAKFAPKCASAVQKFKQSVTNSILSTPAITKKVSGGCSCSPNVTFGITGVNINENDYSCPIELMDNRMRVTMNLPNVVIHAKGEGKCKIEEGIGDAKVCIAKTTVDINATTTISDLKFAFEVTEDQFFGAPITPPQSITGISSVNTTGGASVGCLASVCDWAVENLVNIFTFGTVELDLTPKLDMTNVTDFTQAIDSNKPDPIELGDIKVDEEKVEEYGQASLAGNLASVSITPDGLLASLKGQFKTLQIDPTVEQTPGTALTPAPAPTLPIPGGKQATVLLADDVLNMMYGSMAESGGLKTSCQNTGKTVGDMFPADCDSLSALSADATAVARGTCHGIRQVACDSLIGVDLASTVLERGVCHAA
ncbi:MAG: hypothetical protein OEY43_07250, partial [Gammaproteobacteria bacterium]|nr:hypothetical protein [Gammaproteobacteria bacterium]